MQCQTCQFENRKDAKFCMKCGAKLKVACPQCSTLLAPSSLFCDECGFDLLKSDKAPTVNYSEPQSYTPKYLAKKILTTRSSVEGERKMVTVLFADVANYTSIAENLDPEEVHYIMDGCFKILMDEIHKFEGTINQFTGDGIMALFGAPIAHENHAQRACRAALAIQKEMSKYGEKINEDWQIEFKMRIGLNSGWVVVGAIGDDLRMDYTAVGDTTNLAMRMESIAPPGGALISESTYRLTETYFEFEELGPTTVKGKETPQQVFKLIKFSDVQTRFDASVSRGLVSFVGRKNPMISMKIALDKANDGSGQVLGVVGEAGVGKSRLLLEFIDSLPKGGFTYLEGRCFHYGGSMAYLPFLDILRSYFGIEEDQRQNIINKNIKGKLSALDKTRLPSIVPAFQDLLSLNIDDENWHRLEPNQRKEQTFEELRNLFIRLSEDKPLILAVEDLHWIDKTSEEFLSYFIDWMAKSCIMLILLYRPDYDHQWSSKSYYSKIGLDQLTIESSTELISAILEGSEVSAELKELILSRSAGNPLFIEEFTHTLLENDSIEKRNSQFVLAKRISKVEIPDTIQGIIAARMDRLEDNLKRTMQLASVIGRDFAFRILQTITGLQEELKTHLLNLQGLEFIYEKRLFPEIEYIFKHALTQEVAYNSLLVKRRKEIHAKIGSSMEQIYAERLEEFYEMLAYHFVQAEVWDRAVTYLREAGQRAMNKSAYTEAIANLSKGLEILPRLPETPEHAELELALQLDLARSLIVSKGWSAPEVEQAYTRAYEICKQVGQTPMLAPVLQGLRLVYAGRGDRGDAQRSLDLGEQLLTLAKQQNDTRLLQEAHWALGQTLYYLGELNNAHIHLEQSSTFYTPTTLRTQVGRDAAGTQIATLFYTGWVLWILGYPDKALKIGKKAQSLAHQLSHPFTLGFALWAMAQLNQFRREVQATLNQSESMIAISKKQGFPVWMMAGSTLRAWALAMQGHTKEGLSQMRQFITNQSVGLDKSEWPMVYAFAVEVYGAAGMAEKALCLVAKALALVKEAGYRFFEAELLRLQGELLLRQSVADYRQAETYLHEALNLARSQQAKSLELRAAMSLSRLWHRHGKKEEAYRLLREIYGWFTEGFDTKDLQEAKNLLEELM